MLDASRALVGVAAKSLSPLEDAMSVTQFRALMIIASRGPLHSAALAEAMGIHASNATRACDRLFGDGLINRVEGTTDRRHLMLTLTVRGRRLVDAVTRRRTTAIREILQRIPVQDRRQVAHVFALFADAAGEPREQDLWALGWIDENRGGTSGEHAACGQLEARQRRADSKPVVTGTPRVTGLLGSRAVWTQVPVAHTKAHLRIRVKSKGWLQYSSHFV